MSYNLLVEFASFKLDIQVPLKVWKTNQSNIYEKMGKLKRKLH